MNRVLLTGLLLAASAFAQTSTDSPNIELSAFGPWLICEGPQASLASWLCAGFKPGNETYILLLHQTSDLTVGYRYTIDAIKADGVTPVHLSGIVQVDPRYSSRWTTTLVNLGGPVLSYKIVVDELSVIGTDALVK